MTLALVLGAALRPDGASPTLRRRADRAAQLWQAGGLTGIIASGGPSPFGRTEAGVIQQILCDHGVPPDVISVEQTARTTWDNIRLSLPLIGGAPVVIVTDWYHAPRALLVARAFGLQATCAVVAPRATPGQALAALREVPTIMTYGWRVWTLTRSRQSSK